MANGKLTATKKREVLRRTKLHARPDNTVMWNDLLKICNAVGCNSKQATSLLSGNGFRVVGQPEKSPMVERAQDSKILARDYDVPEVVIQSILNCSIFKQLRPAEEDENPDDMIVITTVGRLKKEREYINKIITSRKARQ